MAVVHADVADSECGHLKNAPTGVAQILWKEAGTGTTKYFMAGLTQMGGPIRWEGCEAQPTEPVEWMVVRFFVRTD